jgi:lysophospholipase L1-like esterase
VKTVAGIGVCFIILVGSWIMVHYKLWERISIFATQPVFGKNWKNEVDKQKTLYKHTDADLIFLGDSHMEQCEWQEIFPESRTANRGIGGESTEGLLARISVLHPGDYSTLVFLQIGINDLLGGRKPADVLESYKYILDKVADKQYSIIPTLVFYVRYIPDVNPAVSELNVLLEAEFLKRKIPFIDLNQNVAENETLMNRYSSDGVHLSADGYRKWTEKMKLFIPLSKQASGSLSGRNIMPE